MDVVVAEQEDAAAAAAAAAAGMDFVERLGPDASAIIFAFLRDPADLARAAAVSRSWHTLVMVVHLNKIQCLRLFPEVKAFTGIEQPNTCAGSSKEDAGSSAAATATAWENHKQEERVYMHLAHTILSPYTKQSCIAGTIGASSTDNFPGEGIRNTLDPNVEVNMDEFILPAYWSSGGQEDPGVPEFLVYKLCSDLCLIDEIRVQPFRAYFQPGNPIYSAQYVRIKFGYPKSPVQLEDLVSQHNQGQVKADDNYMWTYTSSEFPMLQENALQSFKLPRPVLCIGGVVKIEFLGRVQKQEFDDLYYICVAYVQVLGSPLPREFGTDLCDDGLVLQYIPDHESPGDSGCSRSKWHDFEDTVLRALNVTSQGTGFNQELLSRLLGISLQSVAEENVHGESKVARPLP